MGEPIQLKNSPYQVDPELLEMLPYKRICSVPCDCCIDSLPVTMQEASNILTHEYDISLYVRDNVLKIGWFAGQPFFDKHLQGSPLSINLRVYYYKSKMFPIHYACVFFREDGLCALHVLSDQLGTQLKPEICRIFPLMIYNGTVTISKPCIMQNGYDIMGKCVKACKNRTYGYKLFSKELISLLGIEGYEELCHLNSRSE